MWPGGRESRPQQIERANKVKIKAICSILAAMVLGTAVPAHAQTAEIMHIYAYFDNHEEVGGAQDTCDTVTGYMAFRQLTWGRATEDYRAIPIYTCQIGGLGPYNG